MPPSLPDPSLSSDPLLRSHLLQAFPYMTPFPKCVCESREGLGMAHSVYLALIAHVKALTGWDFQWLPESGKWTKKGSLGWGG